MSEIQPTSPPTIKAISLGLQDTELERLKQRFNSSSSKIGSWEKDKIQHKLGGMCVICGGLASQMASYDCAGATRIERYCDACVQKTFSRVDK